MAHDVQSNPMVYRKEISLKRKQEFYPLRSLRVFKPSQTNRRFVYAVVNNF